jgi:hypothetical protein
MKKLLFLLLGIGSGLLFMQPLRAQEAPQQEAEKAMPAPRMQVFVQNPRYRGLVLRGQRQPWQAAVVLTLSSGELPENFAVQSEVSDGEKKVRATSQTHFASGTQRQTINLDVPRDLPLGEYAWNFKLLANSPSKPESTLETVSYNLQVVDKMPKIYIDENQRLIENGKPFFPLGIYLYPTEDEDMARVAKAGFNTILAYSYGEEPNPEKYLDRAHKHGLRVIYSIKDLYEGTAHFPAKKGKSGLELARDYIMRFRQHPALLGWYVNDETELFPQLKAMYELVKQLDPNHPALAVTNHADKLDPYFDTTDIIAVDPYPVPRHPLSTVSDWTDYATKAARGTKAVWVVPQIMAWSVYDSNPAHRAPTLVEMRNMSYLALIHGAQGLIFYQYFDLWNEIGRPEPLPAVFAKRWPEVQSLAEELAGLREELAHSQFLPAQQSPVDSPIHVRVLRTKKQLLILVANPIVNQNTVSLRLPGRWTISHKTQHNLSGIKANDTLLLTAPPFGSGVFRVDLN